MTRTASRANKFAADCATCRTRVAAGAGHLTRNEDGAWIVTCAVACAAPTSAPAVTFDPAALPADQLAYLDTRGFGLFDADSDLRAALVEGGFDPAPLKTAPVRAAQAPARARRTTSSRRRRACITGGNCSSHTGRDCGGHNCDAN